LIDTGLRMPTPVDRGLAHMLLTATAPS
jgi:hypothetical protein